MLASGIETGGRTQSSGTSQRGKKTENRMKMKISSKFLYQTSECPETKAICANGERGRQEPSVLVSPERLHKGTSDVKPTKQPVLPCWRDSAVWVPAAWLRASKAQRHLQSLPKVWGDHSTSSPGRLPHGRSPSATHGSSPCSSLTITFGLALSYPANEKRSWTRPGRSASRPEWKVLSRRLRDTAPHFALLLNLEPFDGEAGTQIFILLPKGN